MDFEFELDEEKAERNYVKHKVSFEEAVTVFFDPFRVTAYDEEHSEYEDRYIVIGMSFDGRILTVIHTDRDDNIRIVSAWKSTSTERILYESNYN